MTIVVDAGLLAFALISWIAWPADLAIRSVGGKGVPDVIHASLMPWE